MKKTLTTIAIAGTLGFAAPAFADETTTPTPTPAPTPSAQEQCRSERDQMGQELFRATYGTNHHKRNAFGRCVSTRSHATKQARKQAKSNASQDCKAEKAQDPAAFAQKYGTGKKARNAHGRCVSQKAAAKTAATVEQQVAADVSAAQACKAERDADSAAFKEKYGSNRNKRNAFGKCVSQQSKDSEQS
jgi:hypothetical protein